MRKEDAVIGARVIAVTAVDGKDDTYNRAGTIIANSGTSMFDICVEFDDYISGHDGDFCRTFVCSILVLPHQMLL